MDNRLRLRLRVKNLTQVAQSEEGISPWTEPIAYVRRARNIPPIIGHLDGADEGLVYVNAGASPRVRNFFKQVIPWGKQLK